MVPWLIIIASILEAANGQLALRLMWNGQELSQDSNFFLENIGDNSRPANVSDPGLSLICVTDQVNPSCCRSSDGDNTGDWFFPDGSVVPRQRDAPVNATFTRTGYSSQVRLNRKDGYQYQYGMYHCVVPSLDRSVEHIISINLVSGFTTHEATPTEPSTVPDITTATTATPATQVAVTDGTSTRVAMATTQVSVTDGTTPPPVAITDAGATTAVAITESETDATPVATTGATTQVATTEASTLVTTAQDDGTTLVATSVATTPLQAATLAATTDVEIPTPVATTMEVTTHSTTEIHPQTTPEITDATTYSMSTMQTKPTEVTPTQGSATTARSAKPPVVIDGLPVLSPEQNPEIVPISLTATSSSVGVEIIILPEQGKIDKVRIFAQRLPSTNMTLTTYYESNKAIRNFPQYAALDILISDTQRRKRQESVQLTFDLGDPTIKCGPSDNPCNGPLKENSQYRVRYRLFAGTAVADYDFFDAPLITKQSGDGHKAAIILGVVIGVVVLLVVTAVVLILVVLLCRTAHEIKALEAPRPARPAKPTKNRGKKQDQEMDNQDQDEVKLDDKKDIPMRNVKSSSV